MRLVDVAIAQDDIVHALIHARLCLMAQVVERLSQALFALLYGERH